jgi:hypothetical protein
MASMYVTTAEATALGLPSAAEQIARYNRALSSPAAVACVDCGKSTAPFPVTGEPRCSRCIAELRFS